MKSIYDKQLEQGRLRNANEFPRVIVIDTTSFCNLKCSMCGHKTMTRKKGRMPWSLFTKIIDEIAETDKSVRVWMVFFGEALLLKRTKPSIFDMISYAKSKGLTDVVLNSNGNLLDGETAQELINSGLDAIYVGIDACTPDTYSKLRIGGNYEKTVDNVINLIKLKKELESEKPEVYVQFVEMEENKNEEEEFINFWKEHGAIVKIRPMLSWANIVEAPNLIPDQQRWPCYWAMQAMSIIDDGKVVLCGIDVDARFVAGDINKQSIKQVWSWNGNLKSIRKMHELSQFDRLPDFCRDCMDWQAARADYF